MTDEDLFFLLKRETGYLGVRLLIPKKEIDIHGNALKDEWIPEYNFKGDIWRGYTNSLHGKEKKFKTFRGALNFIKRKINNDIKTEE